MPYYDNKDFIVVVFAIDRDDPENVHMSRSPVVNDPASIRQEAWECSIDAARKVDQNGGYI